MPIENAYPGGQVRDINSGLTPLNLGPVTGTPSFWNTLGHGLMTVGRFTPQGMLIHALTNRDHEFGQGPLGRAFHSLTGSNNQNPQAPPTYQEGSKNATRAPPPDTFPQGRENSQGQAQAQVQAPQVQSQNTKNSAQAQAQAPTQVTGNFLQQLGHALSNTQASQQLPYNYVSPMGAGGARGYYTNAHGNVGVGNSAPANKNAPIKKPEDKKEGT